MSNVDGVRKITEGNELKANMYNPKTMEEQKNLERAEHALDWKKTVAKVMSQGGTKAAELNHMLNENGYNTGMTDETAASVGDAGTYAITTALGAAMLNQAPKAVGGKSIISMVDDLVSGAKDTKTTQESSGDTKNNKQPKSSNPNHKDTSSSKDTNSIANDTEKVKSPSIAEQIEAQTKKEQVLNKDAKYTADMDKMQLLMRRIKKYS